MENELVQLIESSFLKKEQKDLLLKKFRAEGETAAFFKEFNELLIAELNQRDAQYQEFSRKLDEKIAEAKEVFNEKKKNREKLLEEQTAGIEPTDFDKKNKIWDEFYADLKKLREEHEDETKKDITRMIVGLVSR